MSTKLFKNTEGKVLMSVGNKLIKQPYEFGFGFRGNSTVRIKIPSCINHSSPFTVMIWYKKNDITQYDGVMSFMYENLFGSAYSEIYYGNGNNAFNWRSSLQNISNSSSFAFLAFKYENSIFKVFNNTTSISKNITLGNNLCDIYLGGNYDSGTFQTLKQTGILNNFKLFNRSLSDSEIIYHRNNLLGNDIQSNTGLLSSLTLSGAEVINISGVDQPCIRDYSGNNFHGIIENLPAGTAQQKVDYANANLFVPFQ